MCTDCATLSQVSQGKWFVSHQWAVSVWWQPLSTLASWKHGYLADTQWDWWEEDTIDIKEHIELGWCLRCQRLLSCCAEATGLTCDEIRSVEVLRERWTVRLLFCSRMQDQVCRNRFYPLSVSHSLTQTHTHTADKKSLHTLMQRAQRTARDRAKSHNEKQKQREVNEYLRFQLCFCFVVETERRQKKEQARRVKCWQKSGEGTKGPLWGPEVSPERRGEKRKPPLAGPLDAL